MGHFLGFYGRIFALLQSTLQMWFSKAKLALLETFYSAKGSVLSFQMSSCELMHILITISTYMLSSSCLRRFLRHLTYKTPINGQNVCKLKHHARIIQRPTNKNDCLAILKVVAWNEAWSSIPSGDFCFPPSIVLMSEHCKLVALGETEFLWYSSLIHIHCSGYSLVSILWGWNVLGSLTYRSARLVFHLC